MNNSRWRRGRLSARTMDPVRQLTGGAFVPVRCAGASQFAFISIDSTIVSISTYKLLHVSHICFNFEEAACRYSLFFKGLDARFEDNRGEPTMPVDSFTQRLARVRQRFVSTLESK